MRQISYMAPKTLGAALQALAGQENAAAVLAGGTDLVLDIREQRKAPQCLVDVSKLPELAGIEQEGAYLRLGAAVTFAQLERSPLVKKHANALWQAAWGMGSPQIRNLATLGGNVANASVAADSPGPLMALGAEVALESAAGSRRLALEAFYAQGRKAALGPGEVIRALYLPLAQPGQASAYAKLGKRKALAIPVLGVSVWLHCDTARVCQAARVVINAVSPLPQRLPQVESQLEGYALSDGLVAELLPGMTEIVQQMIPTRASVGYKSESVRGVARQAFDEALAALETE